MNVNFLNKNLNHCEQLTRDYEFASQDELRGKYIFWDIDGTLAAYRFNGHVSDPEGTDNGMSLKEIEDGFFLRGSRPAICRWCCLHVARSRTL